MSPAILFFLFVFTWAPCVSRMPDLIPLWIWPWKKLEFSCLKWTPQLKDFIRIYILWKWKLFQFWSENKVKVNNYATLRYLQVGLKIAWAANLPWQKKVWSSSLQASDTYCILMSNVELNLLIYNSLPNALFLEDQLFQQDHHTDWLGWNPEMKVAYITVARCCKGSKERPERGQRNACPSMRQEIT